MTERYRLATVPGLLLFAGFFLWQLWQRIATGRYRHAAVAAALVCSAAFLASFRRTEVELWALDRYNSGLHALAAENFDSAERKLGLAYAYVPGNAEVNFALGNLHYARGDHEKARFFYLRTLDLNPRHEGTFNNLGVLALDEQQWEAAIKCFEAALAITPQDAKSHYLLARAMLGNGNAERALAEVNEALRLKADQREFLELREQILRR